MSHRHVSVLADSPPPASVAPGDSRHPTCPDPPVQRRRADSLLRRLSGLITGLALITVASHYLGGAAGHWAEHQWDLNAATRPPSGVISHDPEEMPVGTNVRTMEARIRLWRAQLEELEARVARAGQRSDLASLQRIDDLKSRCAVAQVKLDKLKAAGS